MDLCKTMVHGYFGQFRENSFNFKERKKSKSTDQLFSGSKWWNKMAKYQVVECKHLQVLKAFLHPLMYDLMIQQIIPNTTNFP